jgi:hypothetical protein
LREDQLAREPEACFCECLGTTRPRGDTAIANRVGILESPEIRALREAGRSKREIAQVMRVSRGAVQRHLVREGASGTKAHPGSVPDWEPGIGTLRSRCEGLWDRRLEKRHQVLTQGQRMNKSLVRKDFRKEAGVVHAVLHLPSEAVL